MARQRSHSIEFKRQVAQECEAPRQPPRSSGVGIRSRLRLPNGKFEKALSVQVSDALPPSRFMTR